jgi:hypothetical protein
MIYSAALLVVMITLLVGYDEKNPTDTVDDPNAPVTLLGVAQFILLPLVTQTAVCFHPTYPLFGNDSVRFFRELLRLFSYCVQL